MSLLDSVLGQFTGSSNQPAGLAEAVISMIQQHPEGVAGIMNQFNQNGLGHLVTSWMGSGANLPISAQQLETVLGSSQIQAIASKIGLSSQETTGHLAELLPQLVGKLSSAGGAGSASGALGSLLGMLQK
jgi:uncharacterized protein YidB (DUF937 family)